MAKLTLPYTDRCWDFERAKLGFEHPAFRHHLGLAFVGQGPKLVDANLNASGHGPNGTIRAGVLSRERVRLLDDG